MWISVLDVLKAHFFSHSTFSCVLFHVKSLGRLWEGGLFWEWAKMKPTFIGERFSTTSIAKPQDKTRPRPQTGHAGFRGGEGESLQETSSRMASRQKCGSSASLYSRLSVPSKGQTPLQRPLKVFGARSDSV